MASRHICIHCLNSCEKSRDHVIPASWYPDNTGPSVQRWTVPSCRRCNQGFGKLENDLLLRLVLCIDPKSEAVSGLANKALRGLGLDIPDGEIRPQEVSRRQQLKEKLRRQLIPVDELAGKDGSIP